MLRLPGLLVAVLLMCQSALADGMIYPHYRVHRGYWLPRERHVVEVVQPPWSGNFIINGARFTGLTASCLSWAAGERITLVAGDWHGRCVTAVFYNFIAAARARPGADRHTVALSEAKPGENTTPIPGFRCAQSGLPFGFRSGG